RILERLPFDSLERPRCELGAAAALERAELRRLRRADDALAAAAQGEVAVGPGGASVRRRAQRADQLQLLERRLELRAGHAPLDPLESTEGALDRGAQALRPEIRPQARVQVARLADVEHLVVSVAEVV